jgi:hypothetical protein
MGVNVHFNACYRQVVPQDDLWSMARMKNRMRTKNENKKLAKSKTQKGGLGKNEHPAGLTTCESNSGNNGAMKRMCSQ